MSEEKEKEGRPSVAPRPTDLPPPDTPPPCNHARRLISGPIAGKWWCPLRDYSYSDPVRAKCNGRCPTSAELGSMWTVIDGHCEDLVVNEDVVARIRNGEANK